MLIRYIQFKLQMNSWRTLWCLLWCVFQVKGLEKTKFHKAGLQEVSSSLLTDINITGNFYRKARPEEEAHVEELSTLGLCTVQADTVRFWSQFPRVTYNSPVNTWLITISRYRFSGTQHHYILTRELENSITRGKPEVHFVSILHAVASLKAVLPFDYVNTSGPLYVLILHISIKRWILSLTSIINSW